MLDQMGYCETTYSAREVINEPGTRVHASTSGCILDRIVAGDCDAESILANRYWAQLNSYFKKNCNDSFLADDLTQDTIFLALLKCRQGAVRDKGALNGFIYGIGRNLMLSHFRKRDRRATNPDDNIEECGSYNQTTSEHEACLQNSLKLTKSIISKMLIERDKVILKLFYFSKKNKPQICRQLSLSSEHFDRVLYRARARLTEQVWTELNKSTSALSEPEYEKSICNQLFTQ
jgi:RNA polymerase sigma factor (sigma-70 family)